MVFQHLLRAIRANSQFAMNVMYRYVLGFFIMTVERFGAENTVKDSWLIHCQRSFFNYFFKSIIITSAFPSSSWSSLCHLARPLKSLMKIFFANSLLLVLSEMDRNLPVLLYFGKHLLLLSFGFDWEKRKPIRIPPNFYLLLPHHHPKLLFGKSTFLAQKEVGRSVFVFVSW